MTDYEPEPEPDLMQCDCCGQMKEGVIFVVAHGLDTYACEECRWWE